MSREEDATPLGSARDISAFKSRLGRERCIPVLCPLGFVASQHGETSVLKAVALAEPHLSDHV